jgi:drug/metabolite transporter (DMT)-like permease
MRNTSLLIGTLLIIDSMHYVFARMLVPHLSPSASAFFVLLIGTTEVGIYGIATKQLRFANFQKNVWFFLGIGLLVAVSTNLNYASVGYIDPGTASLIGKSGQIWSLGLGLFWLQEKLTRPQFLGATLAIGGVFVISYQVGEYNRVGTFMVLAATFLYALHTGMTKKYGEDMDFVNFFFFRLLITSSFLFLITTITGTITWPSSTAWGYLLLVGTMDVTLSRSIYYIALRRLNLSIHTLVLTLSPVVAILWTIVIFKIYPSTQQLIGGFIVIFGLLIVGKYRESKNNYGESSNID